MSSYRSVKLHLLECNIDDMNPEFVPHVLQRLINAGVRDAWHTPIVMKQGRPGFCLSVLCDSEKREEVCGIIFLETSTLGIRSQTIERLELDRQVHSVETKYGCARVKIARDIAGVVLNIAPEYRPCKDLAEQHKVALNEVYQEVVRVWREENN